MNHLKPVLAKHRQMVMEFPAQTPLSDLKVVRFRLFISWKKWKSLHEITCQGRPTPRDQVCMHGGMYVGTDQGFTSQHSLGRREMPDGCRIFESIAEFTPILTIPASFCFWDFEVGAWSCAVHLLPASRPTEVRVRFGLEEAELNFIGLQPPPTAPASGDTARRGTKFSVKTRRCDKSHGPFLPCSY